MKVPLKKSMFWLVLVCIDLTVLEAGLSVVYFQRNADSSLAVIHYWHQAKGLVLGTMPVGIWQRDPKFGYSHIANSRGTHRALDFTVIYTIGNEKERVIPAPSHSVGRILFLGDSFTFGHGVDDDRPYPYVLSQEYWKDWQIINRAVMGWGTSHADLVLSDELERGRAPAVVIYGMVPEDIARNYTRRSWVSVLAYYNRDHPHFELVNGRLDFQGVINVAGSEEDSPAVRAKELALTAAFLADMKAKCDGRSIPFFVVLFPGKAWPPSIMRALVEQQIPVVDLSEMTFGRFPHDEHPNALDHRLIAEAIDHSVISETLASLTTSLQPLSREKGAPHPSGPTH